MNACMYDGLNVSLYEGKGVLALGNCRLVSLSHQLSLAQQALHEPIEGPGRVTEWVVVG